MIATILGWTKLPQWALELIVILIVAIGIYAWQHARFEAGVKAQQDADAAELLRQTTALQTRATMAEQAYDKEHQANVDYLRDHPIGGVRLCVSTPSVPAARPTNKGNAAASTPTAGVPEVHGGDSSGGQETAGPDIGGMLSPFAAKCDEVSGVLREFQNR